MTNTAKVPYIWDMDNQHPEPAGCAPGSVYATWTQAERAAADRSEAQYNREMRCDLAGVAGTHYVRVAPDESLQCLAMAYRRQIEDAESTDPGGARAQTARMKLADVEREQGSRLALAGSWLAAQHGTHSRTAYAARGGLAAVLQHGAPPPTYELAAAMDMANWQNGLPHALDWDAASPLAALREASKATS